MTIPTARLVANRFAAEEAPEVVCQFGRGRVPLFWLFSQTL